MHLSPINNCWQQRTLFARTAKCSCSVPLILFKHAESAQKNKCDGLKALRSKLRNKFTMVQKNIHLYLVNSPHQTHGQMQVQPSGLFLKNKNKKKGWTQPNWFPWHVVPTKTPLHASHPKACLIDRKAPERITKQMYAYKCPWAQYCTSLSHQ